MATTDDDIPPAPDGVIERVAPILRAALLRAESRGSDRAAKAAIVEHEAVTIKAVRVAHANLSTFLAADTAHPDGATSQIDYYELAYALIDRIAAARKAGVDVRLGEIEIRN
ncbi:hypothetical protein [Rhodococcus koreensis]|uniref:hypothetical protein n=1 Tax=Rhodococcus koreensis TaxID=99653 RepID=UPI0036D7F83B